MTLLDWIVKYAPLTTAFRDIATGIAACITAGVACAGLGAWKRQLHGKEDYEIARRILVNTHKISDATKDLQRHLRMLRTIFSSDRDYKEYPPDFQERQRHINVVTALNIIEEAKITLLKDLWTEMEANFVEAQALWGNSIKPDFGTLQICSTKILYEAEDVIRSLHHMKLLGETNTNTKVSVVRAELFRYNWQQFCKAETSDDGEKIDKEVKRIEKIKLLQDHIGRSQKHKRFHIKLFRFHRS